LGAFLSCLSQTAGSSLAYANTASLSAGEDLLFAHTSVSTPVFKSTGSFPAVEPASPRTAKVEASEDIIDTSDNAPVDLLADSVEYDEVNEIVSAIGNVELVQSGRILRAQKVTYNMSSDVVEAVGDVVLSEVTGEVYFADSVELKDEMKNGFVTGLRGVLEDGSRFTAENAEKISDLKVIMSKASYTACESCKKDPSKAPIWQIKAREVIHHKDEQRVSYKDATLEVAGVPILYSPYFSHTDGTVKRKSGFLIPSIGFDSDLGATYSQEYYWNVAPDKDVTVGAMVMTDVAPLVTGEYRQRFENAEIKVAGGLTYSDRTDTNNGREFQEDNQTRGHLDIEGLWNINDKWRAGTAIEVVSDSQYLRQYNISNEDVLENKVYVERFDGRDYATANLIRFKDIRVSNRKVDQPAVLPEVYSRFIGAPNSLLGGRGSIELSALGLHREGDDQDIGRTSLDTGWERRFVSNWGLVNTLNLNARGDVYFVNDADIADGTTGRNDQTKALRGFANANFQTSYPVAQQFDVAQMVIEPIASVSLGTNLNENDNIPNEDSQDVFLDATNLFNSNRFPGYDRIEDESHVTYGVRTGLYGDNGYQGEVFLGQSYRFDKEDDDSQFPVGSGLSERESDIVGNLSINMGPDLRLNYALQLDNDSFSSQRHEVDMQGTIGPLTLGTRYFYANALQGTDLDESREQIRNTMRLKLTDEWSLIGAMQYDLASETEGLRKLSYGLDYQGQCVTFLINGERKLTKDSSGDSGARIMMRLGLKNLGEFETTGFTVGADE
jgi:LPS-assembly protein